MTRLTDIRGIGVVARFALGDTTVMTTDAGANDFVMIQRGNEG